jgi:hypothetical protein
LFSGCRDISATLIRSRISSDISVSSATLAPTFGGPSFISRFQNQSGVVKAGSMANGATELGISQPNVSKAISDLERALGVTLLDRSPRGVEATTYGLAVIKRGVAVFDELQHAMEEVAFLADPTSGELRLGCTDWCAGSVCLAIDRISRQYPRIKFDVLSSDAGTLQREWRRAIVCPRSGMTFSPGAAGSSPTT